MNKRKLSQIRKFLAQSSSSSKIYFGSDSRSYRKNGEWFAEYYLVVVIHKNGCNGCKIFGDIILEQDYHRNHKKPRFRLMTEVYKVAELYLELYDSIGDKEVEIHLDLNPSEKHVSSCVVQEAIGYIKGMCNVTPMVKPNAFAASYAADRLGRVAHLGK